MHREHYIKCKDVLQATQTLVCCFEEEGKKYKDLRGTYCYNCLLLVDYTVQKISMGSLSKPRQPRQRESC